MNDFNLLLLILTTFKFALSKIINYIVYKLLDLKKRGLMNILDRFIKWIYAIELPSQCSEEHIIIPNLKYLEFTKYNPATGLPMIGGLDIGGNLIGTDRQSDYRYYQ